MKDIGAHVGYKVLWGRVSKVVGAGTQMCYYPAASLNLVMAVLSGTRVVRVLCVWVATPCYVAACVRVEVTTSHSFSVSSRESGRLHFSDSSSK